ncbi:hypothetical protein LPJ38_26945 [Bradyrhizobium daqingense]|uniref:Uncharacterized protein n=1 Tax=Bradyrhizobium daqingense TaxID=993502 RepID=A0A562LMG7_9BRAD|nr:hypothetical protein [Bradyrhizobium daqingense]TWI08829.1 hypothetical protein IQ17_01652 [Bradyrhizobium daqingense]UFS87263.1 hypothetical protein LPJ38_26945 [Bradyrhizobium daqingense]
MSGYSRLCFVSLVLTASLLAVPASSNPFADIFIAAAPQPTMTSPPQLECLGRPGSSTPDGQHWVYRMDGHRKCWFLTEGVAKVKKTIRQRVAKIGATSLDKSGGTSAPRQSEIIDARAELLRSATAESYRPPHVEVKAADATFDLDTGAAPMSATLISAVGRRSRSSVLSQVDVEQLLAAAPADHVVASPEPPAMPIGVRLVEAANQTASRTATWLGVLLMMLGMLSILSTSRSLRHAVRLRY